jgi:hypothetical protein
MVRHWPGVTVSSRQHVVHLWSAIDTRVRNQGEHRWDRCVEAESGVNVTPDLSSQVERHRALG